MRINPIPSGDWINTPRAQQLMLGAAVVTALTCVLLLAMNLYQPVEAWFVRDHIVMSDLLGAIAAAGTFALYFGMWRHWYQQQERWSIHVIWALVFVCLVFYGSLLYWIVRYRRFGLSSGETTGRGGRVPHP